MPISEDESGQWRDCEDFSLCGWRVGPWSPCSKSCGLGRKTRDVWCEVEGECDPFLEPPDRESCVSCSFCSFDYSPWGDCSTTCGDGTQTRFAACDPDDVCGGTSACLEYEELLVSK